MTTLPQTSPTRYRPSNGQLAIPSGGGAGIPAVAGGGGPVGGPGGASGPLLTPADAWRIIRSHMWLIISMVVVSAILGFFANKFLATYYPSYTAFGLARIYTLGELTTTGEPVPQQIEIEQRTQANVLMSEKLWLEVLGNPQSKIRQTVWWNDFKGSVTDAKWDLEKHFAVTPIMNSRLLRVSMEYTVPADAKTIVEEILGQHIRNQKGYAADVLMDRVRPLEQQVEKYESDLQNLQTRLKTKSASVGEDTGQTPLVQLEINRLMEQRVRYESDYKKAMGQLERLNQIVQRGEDPPDLIDKLDRNIRINDLNRKISECQTRIFETTRDGGSGDHPKVQALRREVDALQQQVDDVRQEIKTSLINSLTNEYGGIADSAKALVEGLDQQIDEKKKDMEKIGQVRTEMIALNVQSELTRAALEKVNQELTSLRSKIYVGNASTVEWAAPPQTPLFPTFPRLPMTMSLAVVLGLGLALGIAFLREITDTTVRSPRDIARVGQINLLGMVPHQDDDPQSSGARLPMVIFDAPQSAIAEQFRQIRTRLQHAASLDTTRSILVTSASAGDGKTTVAVNLAAGLALNGRRILLVDANFRRPELHRLFEVGNDQGLSDVLNSLDLFEGAVRETQVPNLSIITTGPRPVNPTELLESQLLIDFIERALEEYDHVIFDTGPLPLVSETVALAPRVDGVVTVVRARTNSRGLLQRLRDELRKVKAENLGVILNGVRAQVGGYYGRNILDYYNYQAAE